MSQEEIKADASGTGSALSRLLSDPEALRSIAALAGALGNGSAAQSSEKAVPSQASGFKVPEGLFENLPEGEEENINGDSTEAVPDSAVAGGSGDILGAVMSSELLSKLPEIISAAGPLMQSFGKLREDGARGGKNFHRGRVPMEKRCALLAAMKPYLSEHRCNTVDLIINISKLSSVLERK